ncbi:Mis12 domain-containing protein [Tricharina praecox]|uniref:Mis12 domain-containing protein n=1 Tax=Tricharina praecox TaxID=43433 RepID=UPI002221151B|nr:Mis12 domain-containing protein [Tricharina praecox]KAI5856901.1 Mis12 domain-containing protein [Tricharina praecox]
MAFPPTASSNALLSEHFGYTPLTLVDDVINSVNELVFGAVMSVENALFKMKPESLGFKTAPGMIRDVDDNGKLMLTEEEMGELQNGLHQLETLWTDAVDKAFDKWEIYAMRNIMVVDPDLVPWVQLAHHKGIDFTVQPSPENAEDKDKAKVPEPTAMDIDTDTDVPSATDAHPVPRERLQLRQLRQSNLASYAFNLKLHAEKAENERLIAQLRTLVASTNPSYTGEPTPFSLIAGAQGTKDAATFVASQFSGIKSLVADVTPKWDEMQRGLQKEPDVALGPEAERRKYIEVMTRKHLEVIPGLRLNAQGEVVGGDYNYNDRKDSEEVQRLEEIAGKVTKGGR